MKFLALLLLAACSCVLSSCKTFGPQTQTTPVAPTQSLPPESARPDSSGISREVGDVRNTNNQLQSEIVWYRQRTDNLTNNLRGLESVGVATKAELTNVRQQSESMQGDLQRVKGIVVTQRDEIGMLDEQVFIQGTQVATLAQERDTLRGSLTTANGNLTLLVQENEAIKLDGDAARVVASQLEGEVKMERKWKWNFFWVALSASVILVGSWALYFYLKLTSPF
jgi:hypothetical protein